MAVSSKSTKKANTTTAKKAMAKTTAEKNVKNDIKETTTEDQMSTESKKVNRFWKVLSNGSNVEITTEEQSLTESKKTGQGRYSGASPYQAANKALTELSRSADETILSVGDRVGALEYITETVQTGGGNIDKEKENLFKGTIVKTTKTKCDIKLDNGDTINWDINAVFPVFKFTMKESTRGSTKREHTYEGCRIPLKTPIKYSINKASTDASSTDPNMTGGNPSTMIKYYKNKLQKLTKEKLQAGNHLIDDSIHESDDSSAPMVTTTPVKHEGGKEKKAITKANAKTKAKTKAKDKDKDKAIASSNS